MKNITFIILFLYITANNLFAGQCTPEMINKMLNSGFSKQEIMSICGKSESRPSRQSDKIPQIDFGGVGELFKISQITMNKKAISFKVRLTKNIDFYQQLAMLNLGAEFYDYEDIKMCITPVVLTPKYQNMQWEKGMVGTGYIVLPQPSKDILSPPGNDINISDVKYIVINNQG